jgi:D-alanyl-D-alanine carboxypeptidase
VSLALVALEFGLMPLFGRALLRRFAALAIAAAALVAAPTASSAADDNYAAIVVDANTGQVLFSRNADLPRYPASLTKMMTLYLVFEDLERGKISLRSRLTVSANAANQAPSKLGLTPGSTIRVEDAILAMVTKSANDVAMVVAENLAASAEAFAQRMTATARSLGMNSTTFRNPHGLPDAGQVTTARDMATLGRALQDRFPQYYGYFATPEFEWAGVTYRNHNNLLGEVEGVDGIKTGYTSASGYNLVTSVKRDGRYLVAVVMGGNTSTSRARRRWWWRTRSTSTPFPFPASTRSEPIRS